MLHERNYYNIMNYNITNNITNSNELVNKKKDKA